MEVSMKFSSTLERLTPVVVLRVVVRLFFFALLAAVLLAGLYLWQFHDGLAKSQGTWGEFGDFIGGALNPIIGLFGLFALFMTLVLQSKELEATRQELQRSVTSAELSTRLAVVNALLSHAHSWHAMTGHVPTAQIQDYKYWVEVREPQLATELDALYKKVYGAPEA
jgi:hypothetical protein